MQKSFAAGFLVFSEYDYYPFPYRKFTDSKWVSKSEGVENTVHFNLVPRVSQLYSLVRICVEQNRMKCIVRPSTAVRLN